MDAALTRASRWLQKKTATAAPLALSLDRERDLGRGRESEKNERERGVTRPTDGNLRHKIAPGLTRVADAGER